MKDGVEGVRITRTRSDLGDEVLEDLCHRLTANPDVAFAHLVDVEVEGVGEPPCPTLFVWLRPEAVGSLRLALNVLAEAVAEAIPTDRFLDVLILNSAPELLGLVERAGGLLVERDPDERRRALEAAEASDAGQPTEPPRGWWPF